MIVRPCTEIRRPLKFPWIAQVKGRQLDREEAQRIEGAIDAAINRILEKGSDDVFKPPIFSKSIEYEVIQANADAFRDEAKKQASRFLMKANLKSEKIGKPRYSLVTKDQNSFRKVAWLDPFDAVKYLAATHLIFPQIEAARIPKSENIVHSHRLSCNAGEIFDAKFGYDSFRSTSSEFSRDRVGGWKVVTDIANFFDRIGNHSLENHLKVNAQCDPRYVELIREMLLFWASDRRSFGIPVGSDASRMLSEAVLLGVDKGLLDRGITFVRYVDDFRIFADSRAEALKSVEILTDLLAEEGLSLNSRKTDVFRIIDPEEISYFANRFAGGEHEKIDLDEKIEVKRAIRVSGRTSISRFYREPGKDALKNIKAIPKESIIRGFIECSDADLEQQIKLVVKFFVYAEQDVKLLKILLERKITSVFYIADALVKEHDRFDEEKCSEISSVIFHAEEWRKCAYPLQLPVVRIAAHPSFFEPDFVHSIIDGQLQSDSMLFYREVISLGNPCLDRSRLNKLAKDTFDYVPAFVQRAIYQAVLRHSNMTEEEKRPILKNMKAQAEDWFIDRIKPGHAGAA